MENYTYRFDNRSLLTRGFVTAFVKPLNEVFPGSWRAHYFSVISHFSVYLALYFSYAEVLPYSLDLVVIPVLLFLYLLADKLDGFRARANHTDSAIGEFVDHFFDIFNRGSLIYIAVNTFGLSHAWVLIGSITLLALVKAAKYYGQYKTGLFVTDKIGAFELTALLGVLMLLSFYGPVFDFLSRPDISGYTFIEGLLVLCITGGLISCMRALMRIPYITYGFWLFVVLAAVVAGTSITIFSSTAAGVITLLYGGLYSGKLLMGQLTDGIERSPGLFTPLLLLIHAFTHYFNSNYVFFVLALYLLISLLLVIFRTFRFLRKYKTGNGELNT